MSLVVTPDLLLAASRRTRDAQVSIGSGRYQGNRAAVSLGLVPSTTSDTRKVTIEIDRDHVRSQRLKKSVVTSARLHDGEARKGSSRGAWYMVTTTYAQGGSSSPRDISELLKRVRGHFHRLVRRRFGARREVFRYIWVGELTQALRPHYHILLWIPRGIYLPKVDAQGWWPHGSSKIEKARNAVGYLAKYASKFTAGMAEAFPKGFRTHGVGGLDTESRRELRWWKSPLDAREFLGPLADIRKALGGYVDRLTGVYWPSPWRVYFENGRTFAWKIESI